MPTTEDSQNWAVQMRLRAVEFRAYWTGEICRQHLMDGFGVSVAQASSDLQRFLRTSPHAMHYDPSVRRYLASESMKCVVQAPVLEEALAAFLSPEQTSRLNYLGFRGTDTEDAERVGFLRLPDVQVSPVVERRVFLATYRGRRLRMKYFSAKSGELRWRLVLPTAFAHDGFRWHVRAWCEENKDYRDFVLGRIVEADFPKEARQPEREDEDWRRMVEIRVRVNPELPEGTRLAYERDYKLDANGILKVTCRAAMEDYMRWALGLPTGRKPLAKFREVD